MPKTPEGRLLAAVEARLKALAISDDAFLWRKRHGSPMGRAGDPDLYGVWRGVPWEMELKREGESPTLLQAYTLNRWRMAGAKCFVVRSLDEFADAIESLRAVVVREK